MTELFLALWFILAIFGVMICSLAGKGKNTATRENRTLLGASLIMLPIGIWFLIVGGLIYSCSGIATKYLQPLLEKHDL